MQCANCKNEIPLYESWPGDNGDICQDCWEKECSKSWWEMVEAVQANTVDDYRMMWE